MIQYRDLHESEIYRIRRQLECVLKEEPVYVQTK